jgi:L-asparaginase / beta-aspartyl-peptidase
MPAVTLLPQALHGFQVQPAVVLLVSFLLCRLKATNSLERPDLSVNPVILIHGGAWAIPDDMVEAHLQGVAAAAAQGWELLKAGGNCLDAVEAAVVAMEEDEAFDAGRGSFLNSDGRVQLDALMMDGATLRAGGVGCVEHIRNPIRVAKKVLTESPHVYFVADGAERFAQQHGIELCANEELVLEREVQRLREAKKQAYLQMPDEFGPTRSSDTVGAVALDSEGNIAAATSTGGTLNKAPGRVGDSSLIGCGCYADNRSAAVSTTGWGEPMMKLVLSKWAADRVEGGVAPQPAAQQALHYLKTRLNGHGGIIIVDARGRVGLAHNTPRMAWALCSEQGSSSGIHSVTPDP